MALILSCGTQRQFADNLSSSIPQNKYNENVFGNEEAQTLCDKAEECLSYDLASAVFFLSKALKMKSHFPYALYGLAVCFFKAEDYTKALLFFNKAKKQFEQEFNKEYYDHCSEAICDVKRIILCEKGDRYFDAGDYEKAKKYFLEVLECDVTLTHIVKKIGECYHYLREYKQALVFYQKARKQYELNDDKESCESCNEAIKNIQAAIQYEKGENCFDADNVEPAMRHFSEALKLNDNFPAAFAGMGSCYYCLNDYKQALMFYKKAKKQYEIHDDKVNSEICNGVISVIKEQQKSDLKKETI
jgi:tetratricopeptide (TPR) repeat protein